MEKHGKVDKDTPDGHGVPTVDLKGSKLEQKVESEDDRRIIKIK